MEDSLPSLSLQINVPVLSLALTVVLMVAALSLFLAFKRMLPVYYVKQPLHLVMTSGYYWHFFKLFAISRWTIWSGLKESLVRKYCCLAFFTKDMEAYMKLLATRINTERVFQISHFLYFFDTFLSLQFVLQRTSSHHLWDPDEEASSGECLHTGLECTPTTNHLSTK